MNTRSLLRALSPLALASSLIALAHCGGQVAELPDCPTDPGAACVANDACRKPTGDTCNGAPVAVTCHCGPSGFACDAPAACPPPPAPPSCGDSMPSGACSVEGWTCSLPATPGMCGGSMGGSCVCQGGEWACAMPVDDCLPEPEPSPVPPTSDCPPPRTIAPGALCPLNLLGSSCPAQIDDGSTVSLVRCECAIASRSDAAQWDCGFATVDGGSSPPNPGR